MAPDKDYLPGGRVAAPRPVPIAGTSMSHRGLSGHAIRPPGAPRPPGAEATTESR